MAWVIFSALYWAFFVAMLPILFLGAAIVFLVTAPFDRGRRVLSRYTGYCALFYIFVNPLWRVKVTGRDLLPRRGPAIYISNHESLVDILVLFGVHRPFKWVSKKSNFKLPIIGLWMRMARYVELERGNRNSVIAMFERCRALLAEDLPILIFPEGTRTPDGSLLPFKDGAFHLAATTGVPIYPLVVRGTGEALPKKGLVLKRHIRASVEVLEPIEVAGKDQDALRIEAQELYERELGRTPGAMRDS